MERVGILENLGLPEKIESDSRVGISGTSLKNVKKKVKCCSRNGKFVPKCWNTGKSCDWRVIQDKTVW